MATTPECAWIAGHADGFDPECAWCHAWRDDPSFVPGKAWKDSEASRAMSLPPRPHNQAFDRSCCRTNVDQPHDAYCVSQPAPGMTTVTPADPKLVAQIDQKAAETSAAIDRLIEVHLNNVTRGVPFTEALLALTTGIDHGWKVGRPELCGLLAVAIDRMVRSAIDTAKAARVSPYTGLPYEADEPPQTMDQPRALGEQIEPWHGHAGGFQP